MASSTTTHHPYHVYLVSFPGQGHINPLLRLGKLLASKGLFVTFCTTEIFGHGMRSSNNLSDDDTPSPLGSGHLRFDFISDSWSPHDPRREDLDLYLPELELRGRLLLPRMLHRQAVLHRPVSCLIHNPFIPWVSDVASLLGIPSALLWVQSCAAFSCYYHYNRGTVPFPSESAPLTDVELPSMPVLKHDEIPSFLHPSTPYPFLRRAILGQYRNLSSSFCVLMDTFDELEPETIAHVSTFAPVKAVGPLFKNPQVPSSALRGDFLKADDCIEWLDSREVGSVVYVSLGSVVYLKQEQVDEIAEGLVASGLGFIWVMKPPHKDSGRKEHTLPEGFAEGAGERGKVVRWAPQEGVLAHPSVGCFMSHCGWNSTMESLSSGVPVAAFPQWGDQVTDCKYLVEVFGVGERLCRGEAEGRIVGREEIKEGLLKVCKGEGVERLRENGRKWKKAAEEAVEKGGSSDKNLEEFIEDVKRRSLDLERPLQEVVMSSGYNFVSAEKGAGTTVVQKVVDSC